MVSFTPKWRLSALIWGVSGKKKNKKHVLKNTYMINDSRWIIKMHSFEICVDIHNLMREKNPKMC